MVWREYRRNCLPNGDYHALNANALAAQKALWPKAFKLRRLNRVVPATRLDEHHLMMSPWAEVPPTDAGFARTRRSVLRTAYASALTRAFEDGRRILFSLPGYHMFGYVEGLLSVLYVGGAIIPLTGFSAERYFAGIQRHGATDLLCVPTMAVAMVESPLRSQYDLSSLKAILCGSAPPPIWLWAQIAKDFGVHEIVTGYGRRPAPIRAVGLNVTDQ